MKCAHRGDIYIFSTFDEARDLDFHGHYLARPDGGVLVDPVPLSDHDRKHVERLGGAAWVLVTNSDHVRASVALAREFEAQLAGPAAEESTFPVRCDRWLQDGEWLDSGIRIVELQGSKTPGELALVVDEDTLIFGDLVRGHRGGQLNTLPANKLADPEAARRSLARLATLPGLQAALVGDGWPAFRNASAHLAALASPTTAP